MIKPVPIAMLNMNITINTDTKYDVNVKYY